MMSKEEQHMSRIGLITWSIYNIRYAIFYMLQMHATISVSVSNVVAEAETFKVTENQPSQSITWAAC